MKPIVTTIPPGGADTRLCVRCSQLTFWVSTDIDFYSASGYRKLRVLLCENHPTPTSVAENADGTYSWAVPE